MSDLYVRFDQSTREWILTYDEEGECAYGHLYPDGRTYMDGDKGYRSALDAPVWIAELE